MPRRAGQISPTTLRAAMSRRGVSADDIAAHLDISPNTVHSWLDGTRAPSAPLLVGLARALGLRPADLTLVSEDEEHRHMETVAVARGRNVPVVGLTARAAQKLSEATTPPGIFAVCTLLDADLATVLQRRPTLLAVAVEPREPGNAGTLIRTADAMGADAVVFLGDAVDPHNGKCVRASAGSLFHLPIVRERDTDAALGELRAAGIGLVATAALALVLDGLVLALGRLCLPWTWKRVGTSGAAVAGVGAATSGSQEGKA